MDTKTDMTRPSLIREDIDETREALTEKLETLEERLRDGVETAKHTVEEKIENVRSSVRKISPIYQTKRNPWLAVGATAVAGFAMGRWINSSRRDNEFFVNQLPDETLAEIPRTSAYKSGEGSRKALAKPTGPSLWDRFSEQFGDEIEMVKTMALTRVIDSARDYAKRTVPSFAAEIDQVLDSALVKVEGAPAPERSQQARNTAH